MSAAEWIDPAFVAYIVYAAAFLLLLALVVCCCFKRRGRRRQATGGNRGGRSQNQPEMRGWGVATTKKSPAKAWEPSQPSPLHAYEETSMGGSTANGSHTPLKYDNAVEEEDFVEPVTPSRLHLQDHNVFRESSTDYSMFDLEAGDPANRESAEEDQNAKKGENKDEKKAEINQFKSWRDWADAVETQIEEAEVHKEKEPTELSSGGGILKTGRKLRPADSVRRIEEFRMEVLREKRKGPRFQPLPDIAERPSLRKRRQVSFRSKSGLRETRVEEYESGAEMEQMRKVMTRKLSQRSHISDLYDRKILIKFTDDVKVEHVEDYDRKPNITWNLSKQDKVLIKKELNEFKRTEMEVHDESAHMLRIHEDGPQYPHFEKAPLGSRVYVEGYGEGILRFYGPHKTKPGYRCGVEFIEPIGLNNGCVGGHVYFVCDDQYGLLCSPKKVELLSDDQGNEMDGEYIEESIAL